MNDMRIESIEWDRENSSPSQRWYSTAGHPSLIEENAKRLERLNRGVFANDVEEDLEKEAIKSSIITKY